MTNQNLMIKLLKNANLTKQQKKTLRGQIIAGDLQGAAKGFEKILKQNVFNGNF